MLQDGVRRIVAPSLLKPGDQAFQKRVAPTQRLRIADQAHVASPARHRHVHAAGVRQEADGAGRVGPGGGDDDGLFFPALETVHRGNLQALPACARFGGGPSDYQLVEEEDEDGCARLSLRVSPQIGEIREEAAVELLYRRIRSGGRDRRLYGDIWREGGSIRVVRAEPVATQSGKILPFHTLK